MTPEQLSERRAKGRAYYHANKSKWWAYNNATPAIHARKALQRRAWYEANKKSCQTRSQEYVKVNRNRISEYQRWHHIAKKYNLTRIEFNYMFEAQKGLCAVCFGPGCGRFKKLHVDHCHKTNKVRGLLCDNCNRGLGHFKEDSGNLLRATLYVELHARAALVR